jgi:hypothetical protein
MSNIPVTCEISASLYDRTYWQDWDAFIDALNSLANERRFQNLYIEIDSSD